MPLWFAAYLVAFVAYAAWTTIKAIRTGASLRAEAVEFVGDASLVVSALAYWYSPIREALGDGLLVVFVIGPTHMIASAIPGYLEFRAQPFVTWFSALQVPLIALAIACTILGPLLYFGFLAAVLGRYDV